MATKRKRESWDFAARHLNAAYNKYLKELKGKRDEQSRNQKKSEEQ